MCLARWKCARKCPSRDRPPWRSPRGLNTTRTTELPQRALWLRFAKVRKQGKECYAPRSHLNGTRNPSLVFRLGASIHGSTSSRDNSKALPTLRIRVAARRFLDGRGTRR